MHTQNDRRHGVRDNRRRQGARTLLGVVIAVAALAAILVIPNSGRAADSATMAEYQRQYQALASDDVDGHVKLALWCRDKEAWDLLVTQCNHVLSLAPDHRLAKLLLELAKSNLGEAPAPAAGGTTGTPAATPAPGAAAVTTELLTREQVQILRRKELRVDGSERVRVDLKNKVDERFLNYVTMRENLSPAEGVAFKKLNPMAKAMVIIGKVRQWERESLPEEPFQDEFSEDIIIENDPLIFKEFTAKVWPIIARGCATSGCHSGPKASPPVLYNERRMTDEMLYTNYLILNDYDKDGARLVNRDFPEQSLLLVYGQPVAGNQSTVHPSEIKPLYQSPNDRKYLTVGRWIAALGLPAPDYGISIELKANK